ncbi:MAG TPA: hypothetical protein VF677_14440 [Flavobacterium sp.]|jgi:hypothetical protein
MKKIRKKSDTIGGIAHKISEGFYINIKRPPVHNLEDVKSEDPKEEEEKHRGNSMPEEETGIEKTINPDKPHTDSDTLHQ